MLFLITDVFKTPKKNQHAGKCDDRKQFKDILEAVMVSTTEGITNNSTISTITPTPVKKPSARKSLCLFTNILDVNLKTSNRWHGASKSKRKVIKGRTKTWEMITKQKGYSKINDHINKYLYYWIMHHPQVVKSPILMMI